MIEISLGAILSTTLLLSYSKSKIDLVEQGQKPVRQHEIIEYTSLLH
jgi:hypothetical protein